MTSLEAAKILKFTPANFGKAVGFTKLAAIHNSWMLDMINGKEDETIQGHRGSYKTTCISVSFACIMILYPNEKIGFFRKTDRDVKEVIAQTQKILLNPVTQEISRGLWGVGIEFIKNSATEITTSLSNDPRGTSQLMGMGINGSITGKHFDRIFTDDIVNIDDRTSQAEREHTKIVYQELRNIINRGGRIFNTGTPWHKDDCFNLMPNPKKYDCYTTGLISDEELLEIKAGMLPSLFAANYELRHIASEDVIFVNPITGGDPAMIDQARHCHIDAAYGGEDYTAFTICKKVDGKYYVFGKLWRRHVDDCLSEIIEWRKHFNAGKIYMEDNGDKGYLAKNLKMKDERVGIYHESMNKFRKITSYLYGEWKNVVFVAGTDESYIRQIEEFNEEAEHDDAPDSLASIVRLLWRKQE